MRPLTCSVCCALVKADDLQEHFDWHSRLERAVLGIPDPPPVPKRL